MYSIARACSRDQIDQCSCDNTERTPPEDGEFQWGGCGDNLVHGYNYARRFSAQASASDASSLLNKHNSEAGRLVSETELLMVISNVKDSYLKHISGFYFFKSICEICQTL